MSGNGANWSGGQALGTGLLLSALQSELNFAKDSLFGSIPQAMAAGTMQARNSVELVTKTPPC